MVRQFVTVPYTHVLLDFDHTLLDTECSLELAFVDAMRAVGADPTDRYPTFDDINRRLWQRVEAHELSADQVHIARFEQLDATLGLDADPAHMAQAFATGMGAHGDLYDGARDMLEALASNATLAMVTNGLSAIQRARLARLELEHFFATVTISAEVGMSKPARGIFDLTLSALDEPDRQSVLMVGDSLSADIAGGIGAGVATCWYNPTASPMTNAVRPTHTITSLADLPGLVAGH